MRKNFFLLLAASVVMLSSCSKLKDFTAENFTVTPTPLECAGGEVPATISANIPAKFMNKKAVVTCIPVLRWDGGEKAGAGLTLQGEKVEQNNQIISYKNGGHATLRTAFPFVEGMEQSDLYMTFDAVVGNKKVNLPDVKIGYGTNCTSNLVSECVKSANNGVAPDNFQRVISQKQSAVIKFLIGQANLRGSELNSSNVKDFIATLKNIKSDSESLVLNNIEVSAYASPDGKLSFNEKLAERREQTSSSFVKKELSKVKLDTNVDTEYTAEDWEGFQELVAQSNLNDKDLILRVLSMYKDPEQREAEIKNIAVVYKDLADAVLPELRRARMTINYEVIGRSDAEIMETFASDPEKLSVEEMLYASNMLSENDTQKETILNQTVKTYPKDYRAYNNLAEIAMRKGDYTTATEYINKALKANPTAPEANTNLGLIALKDGQLKDAEAYLAKGAASANSKEALGNLYIAQGKYNLAARNLDGVISNSAALAQILNEDYAAAKKTLANIKNADAMTSYLKAIFAARLGDKSGVLSNLEDAKKLDPSLAAKDIEFAKYLK